MAIVSNRRKFIQQVWYALIIATFIGCVALIYGSLQYGEYHFTESRYGNFLATQEKLTEANCIPVCGSEECVHESKLLLDQVDPSVDPCENFFEFACGRYLERFARDEGNTVQDRMEGQMHLRIKDILETTESNEESASGKVKMVYDSCVQRSSSEMKAVQTVVQILSQLGIRDWPVLDGNFSLDLTTVLSRIIAHDEYAFLDISAKWSFRTTPCSEVNASIEIQKGSFESRNVSDRKYLVEKVLLYFNVDDENIAKILNESEAILDAIIQLKQESERFADGDEFRAVTLDCASEDESEWTRVCELLKSFVDIIGVDNGASNRFLYLRGSTIYFAQNVFHLLDRFSDRSIANFLTLNLLFNHLDDLNFYFRQLFRTHPISPLMHAGSDSETDRWQHCAEWLMKTLFIPLGHKYMKSALTKSVFDEIDDLVRDIFREMSSELSHQNWITESVRSDMTRRIEYLKYSVALLKDKLTNDTFINDLYKEFLPKEDSFLYNVFEHQRYSKLKQMKGTLFALDMSWTDSSLLMPQAVSGGGKIDLQLGILMPPIYRPHLERMINFLTLSSVVAHEVGHVFQEFYRTLVRSDERAKNYTDEVTSCVIHQYSQFRYQFILENVKGEKHIREDFPDLIAVSFIDKMIEKYSRQNEALSIPGFPYFAEQLLYVSSMQMYCAASTGRDEEINKISLHSLPKFRMTGMMQNSRGFSKAFNCSEGSYMNPPTKCSYFMERAK